MSDRAWRVLWQSHCPLVGMIHLPPLPGAPGWSDSMERILKRAGDDARTLTAAGFDALMVENYGDIPFRGDRVDPVTVAALTRAVDAAQEAAARERGEALPVGVNVLRNDAAAALGIAAATGARFIRVNVHVGSMWTDQGLLEGRAADSLRLRRSLGVDCAILADVHVKHATPPAGSNLTTSAADTWHRGGADALIVTGDGTGSPTALDHVDAVRKGAPEAPVLVGSGVTSRTVSAVLQRADGVIVGSDVMVGGRAGGGVDRARAEALVAAARG